MADLDQIRRNVQVLDLLTEAFTAHQRGDLAVMDAAGDRAAAIDAAVVVAIRGGMIIGEIPNPDHDWPGWMDYVAGMHGKLADAEAGE